MKDFEQRSDVLEMAFYKIHSCETTKAVLEGARLEERRQLGRLCNNVGRKYMYIHVCTYEFFYDEGKRFLPVFCFSYFQGLG